MLHVLMMSRALTTPLTTSYTPDQFYCQNTREASIRCLSLSQFADSPFGKLCPSGSCLSDCQDLERLYQVTPSGVLVQSTSYGSVNDSVSDMVTLYGLCLSYSNISRALEGGKFPADQDTLLRPFFPSTTERELQIVTNSVTNCLSETCASAVHSESCAWECSPAQLLIDGTTPLLTGGLTCLQLLCQGGNGLPFGNQDVVGIGVSYSSLSLSTNFWTIPFP